MSVPDPVYDSALVEEAVRVGLTAVVPGDPLPAEYRARLDELYLLKAGRRPAAAEALHSDFFRRLGWDAFFRSHLDRLLPRLSAAGVRGASRQEGCFVDAQRRLQVLLRPARLTDRPSLSAWLRHEVMHAEDMLDPAFGYRNETLDEPTRERYGRLWCESIERRRTGRAVEPTTHEGLLQRARGLGRPKCGVCDMPAAVWGRPSPEVQEFLKTQVPSWSPEAGVCSHCLEWAELTAPTTAGRRP